MFRCLNCNQVLKENQECPDCPGFMSKTFRKGQRVMIYQKPATKEDFEGIARLVNEYRPDDEPNIDGFGMWEVEFENEPEEVYLRTVQVVDLMDFGVVTG